MTDYDIARELVSRLTGIPLTEWCGHRRVGMLTDLAARFSRKPDMIAAARLDMDAVAKRMRLSSRHALADGSHFSIHASQESYE